MLFDFLHFSMNAVLFGFLWRFLQLKLAGQDIGKAMAYIY